MTKQSGNVYEVKITIPAGATASQINLTDGSNFAFNGKTFNLDITFADGTYNDDMVNAIKGKFTAKGGAVGTTITTPEKPQQPVVALPVLTVGAATANITKDSQNANIFNVSITIPNGAAPGNVGLTDGSNFAFNGKTFNLDITFAGGTYNDDMVDAIKGKFTAKGGAVGTTITTPEKPTVITPPTAPTLKIDGVVITIPVPAEGVDTISVSAVVSNGTVADFEDPSGVLAGKVVNLSLSADPGQNNRINYTAITAIETAFKSKGAAAVSSDTTLNTIPAFVITSKDDSINDDLALLASKATAENPDVKIVDGIKALYNSGNPILQVSTPMQLKGDIFCSQLDRIQTTQGNIYADDSLRLWENGRKVTLAEFLAAYENCGFSLTGNNNFLPKPGIYYGGELSLRITDDNHDITSDNHVIKGENNWNIYKLFERYHAAGKIDNLMQLYALNVTVAGETATGLYGTNPADPTTYNQPLASFPYKVNGQVIGSMAGHFKAFENMFEDGTRPPPVSVIQMRVKNFATESNNGNTQFYADGACFFEHAPPRVESTGAVKIMDVGAALVVIRAEYLDLRNLTMNKTRYVKDQGMLGEIAFSTLNEAPQTSLDRVLLNYDTGYYVDSDGVTKLIPTGSECYASNQISHIYGVLDLQSWVNGNPPRDKAAIQPPLAAKLNPTQPHPALFSAPGPVLAAILDERKRNPQRS